jgi:hypothetical protein
MLCLFDEKESLHCVHALRIPVVLNLRREAMITVKDCEAFCDASPNWVHELACRECLTMVPAYARAHETAVCSNGVAMPARQDPAHVTGSAADYRLAA